MRSSILFSALLISEQINNNIDQEVYLIVLNLGVSFLFMDLYEWGKSIDKK